MTAQTPHELRETLARLEARVAAQEVELAAIRTERRRRAPSRGRRLRGAAVLLALALLVALPVSILAADAFADVKPGDPGYNEIAAIAAAGITKGCGTNTAGSPIYCPADFVRRDQMAVFLNRGLGRLSTTSWSLPPLTNNAPFASTQITTEGNEYIVATASFYTIAYSGQAAGAFPCEGTFAVRMDGAADPTSLSGVSLSAAPGAPYETDGVTTQGLFLAPPGRHTIDVLFVQSRGTCTINMGVGRLVAQVVPFGSTGAAATGTDEPHDVPQTLGGR